MRSGRLLPDKAAETAPQQGRGRHAPSIAGLVTIVIGVGGCLGYFYFSNQCSIRCCSGRGENAGRNINRANQIRPWLFLFPAMFALGLYLAYPVFETLRLSLTDRDRRRRVRRPRQLPRCSRGEVLGGDAQQHAVADRGAGAATAFGLLAAQLTDRIGWGNIAKSLIFMPMAISFVGASVIFKLIYEVPARPTSRRSGPERRLAAFRRRDLVVPVPQGGSRRRDAGFAALTLWLAWDILRASPGVGQSVTTPCFTRSRPRRCRRRPDICESVWLTAAAVSLLGHLRCFGFWRSSLWRAADLADHPLLEQLLPDDRADLDPDRLRHGDPLGGAARHSRRRPSRRRSSTAPTRSRSSSRSRCRRSWAPSSWSGRRSRWSCSRSSTSSSP
jgi:hypothetical protein